MKILITNDDGINSEGIIRLSRWAQKFGDVTMIAPLHEQSGKSRSVNFITPFKAERVEDIEGIKAYAVDSTPADCIRYAFYLGEHYDLVLSGINNGFNVGEDIGYSGTCGAIFEAANRYIPSVALSTDRDSAAKAEKLLDGIYGYMADNKLFDIHKYYNINIPGGVVKGIKIVREGGGFYRDLFVKPKKNHYMAWGITAHNDRGDLTVDTDAIVRGYITIQPVTTNHTDFEAFGKLINQ